MGRLPFPLFGLGLSFDKGKLIVYKFFLLIKEDACDVISCDVAIELLGGSEQKASWEGSHGRGAAGTQPHLPKHPVSQG